MACFLPFFRGVGFPFLSTGIKRWFFLFCGPPPHTSCWQYFFFFFPTRASAPENRHPAPKGNFSPKAMFPVFSAWSRWLPPRGIRLPSSFFFFQTGRPAQGGFSYLRLIAEAFKDFLASTARELFLDAGTSPVNSVFFVLSFLFFECPWQQEPADGDVLFFCRASKLDLRFSFSWTLKLGSKAPCSSF